MKPSIVLFSSGDNVKVLTAMEEHLKRDFKVTVWPEIFGNTSNSMPLNDFLKRLMCFDFAALILGSDNIQIEQLTGEKKNVPRDNVIFELGACMARLGPQKTFILVPSDLDVVLPTYLKGLYPLEYGSRPDARGNYTGVTRGVCATLTRCADNLSSSAFHSDLPAQGLAIGYFKNLVAPILSEQTEATTYELGPKLRWSPANGIRLTTLVSAHPMTGRQIDERLQGLGAKNIQLKFIARRNLSVYALPRSDGNSPIELIDIPTTLQTSQAVIALIDDFWGGADDDVFRNELEEKEVGSFVRLMNKLGKEIDMQYEARLLEEFENERV